MAMGLPVVCTDCPAGGARAVINDGENGLLVPVGDSEKLYLAMKRVVEDKELSQKLSRNAVLVRETQSLEKIIEKWKRSLFINLPMLYDCHPLLFCELVKKNCHI